MPNPILSFGKVGLFFGVETFFWMNSDGSVDTAKWIVAADFCVAHHVDFAIIKCFDAGNEWYNGKFATDIEPLFTKVGVRVLPYGFCGTAANLDYNLDRDLPGEIVLTKKYLQAVGVCCMDIEGDGWVHRPDLGQMIATELAAYSGIAFSLPANPVDAGMVDSFTPLASLAAVFMPMSYSDYLISVTYDQMNAIKIAQARIAPTYDLSQEFGQNTIPGKIIGGTPQASFWYDGFAEQDTGLFDSCVSKVKGGTSTMIPVVFNAPQFTEFFNGLVSACGAAAVTTAAFGTKNDGVTPSYPNTLTMQQWMANEYINRFGRNDPNDAFSNSVADMEQYFKDTQPNPPYVNPVHAPNELHYFEYLNGPNYNEIVIALQHGYASVVNVSEATMFDLDLNQFVCQFHENHLLVISGLDPDGNYLVFDTCPTSGAWPRRYRRDLGFGAYGAIVKMPWNPTIPSGTPSTWSTTPVTTTSYPPPHNQFQLAAANKEWNLMLTGPSLTDPKASKITQLWFTDFLRGVFHGSPHELEGPYTDWSGHPGTAMRTGAGRFEDINGVVKWFKYT